MPKPNPPIDAQTVVSTDGRKVRVLFYDDGSYRFRVYDCPLVIEEAFLSGNAQGNSIIKLAPKPSHQSAAAAQVGDSGEDVLDRARNLGDPALVSQLTRILGERATMHGWLVDVVTRFGNHPDMAPMVPGIQKFLGMEDIPT